MVKLNILKAVLTGVLFLLYGAIAPAYAQRGGGHEGREEEKMEQQGHGERGERQEHFRGEREHRKGRETFSNQWGPNEQRMPQFEQRSMWQDHRANNWDAEHRTWGDRGGYRGERISDERFRESFGRDHDFRMHDRDMVIFEGFPCFFFGGFWFSIVDPWPEYWGYDWYETDVFYIDYVNDGYYLFDRRHPGVGLAVSVVVR
ncbi:MAG TPA: hypothetical protein VF857_03955 [Spirochaetota bacterium]